MTRRAALLFAALGIAWGIPYLLIKVAGEELAPSVLVLARRSRYRDFEEHRKRNGFGTFLTGEDLERRRPFQTSDLFFMIAGFKVSGFGLDAKVLSARGVTTMNGRCEANIVIDGMPGQDINLIHPSSIGAMEIYRAGQPGPVQYDRGCGVIVIWSKR